MRKLLLALLSLALTSSVGAQSCCDRDAKRDLEAGLLYPGVTNPMVFGFVANSTTLNAANTSILVMGNVYIDGEPTSKVCSTSCTISWRTGGGITWANDATAVTIGLQDVNTAAGPPQQTDDSFDAYVQITPDATPGAGLTTKALSNNTWTTVTMTDGTKTVTHGGLYGVVFDMTARGGADALQVSSNQAAIAMGNPSFVTENAGTYTAVSSAQFPNIIIAFDDGTLGWFDGSVIYGGTNPTLTAFTTASNPDEYAVCFTVPKVVSVDGLYFFGTVADDAQAILYSDPYGTPTAMSTVTHDGNYTSSASAARWFTWNLGTRKVLRPGVTYAAALKATTATANNAQVLVVTAASAPHLKAWAGTGTTGCTRDGGSGAFSASTTTMPIVGVRIREIQ